MNKNIKRPKNRRRNRDKLAYFMQCEGIAIREWLLNLLISYLASS